MTYWLIVVTPTDGTHCHQMPPGYPTDQDIQAATATHGVPDNWYALDGAGWDVSLTDGTPHPSLLARSTVHRQDGTVIPPGGKPGGTP